MNKLEYPALGETVYEETMANGLKVIVAKKPGFQRSFAMFATRYGGADRRFKYNGQWIDTPAGVAHFLEHKMFDMPDGTNVKAHFTNMAGQKYDDLYSYLIRLAGIEADYASGYCH